MKKINKRFAAKFSALALALCTVSPISASGYSTSLDNGREWSPLPAALTGYGFGGGLAVSADGQIIYVGADQIRFSQDGGKTWSNRSGAIDIIQGPVLATSADGRYVVAVVNQERTWISSDYGVTWTAALPQGNWQRADMSSSGQYIVVTSTAGFLYISRDYGASFTQTSIANEVEGQDTINDVSISGDGSRIVVSTNYLVRKIYVSNNTGSTFSVVPTSKLPSIDWSSVEISGDGATLLAADESNSIWMSRDGGSTWSLSGGTGISNSLRIMSATISFDGSKIALGMNGTIIVSTDTGMTWSTRSGAPNAWFFTVDMSQDGLTIFANGNNTLYRSLPTIIYTDYGTVTLLSGCFSDTSTATSVQAASVILVSDTASAASQGDGSTYKYYSETDTALWGANYTYGSTQNPITCGYRDMNGTVTLSRGRFISSVNSGALSETNTNTTDFLQYIGNTETASAYSGIACGNMGVTHAASVTTSCTTAIQNTYSLLTYSSPVQVRTSNVRTGVLGQQSGKIYTFVKVLKSVIASAPAGTSWVATETFTVTSS